MIREQFLRKFGNIRGDYVQVFYKRRPPTAFAEFEDFRSTESLFSSNFIQIDDQGSTCVEIDGISVRIARDETVSLIFSNFSFQFYQVFVPFFLGKKTTTIQLFEITTK